MPQKKLTISGATADVLSWVTHELGPDETAMLRNVSRLPCLYKHVALMPDAHLGKGSMVGSVIATKDAVIPATVGVDIGCGMMAVKTPFKSGILDRKLAEFRHEIERAIPVGFNDYKEPVDESLEWDRWSEFEDLHKGVQDRKRKAMKQLGTLGGGNHFIEVCLDTDDNVWLMLHSGSRNIGNEVATRHIATAKSLHDLNTLPAADLAYFIQGTPEFQAYWHDLEWSQSYAMKNREIVMIRLVRSFVRMFGPAFRELEKLPESLAFKIIRTVDLLSTFPQLGPDLESRFPDLAGLRQLTIDRRWRVIYEIDESESTVWILAIQNCRQRLPSSRKIRKRKGKT